MELYFALAILFMVCVSAFAAAEKYIEAHVFGNKDSFSFVKKLYRGKIKEVSRNSDEFYCFFKKDTFDVE